MSGFGKFYLLVCFITFGFITHRFPEDWSEKSGISPTKTFMAAMAVSTLWPLILGGEISKALEEKECPKEAK